MNDLGTWIGLGTFIIVGAIGWGVHMQRINSSARAIDTKADIDAVRELKTKVDGIDLWTRTHDKEANDYRLHTAERFALLEKSIEDRKSTRLNSSHRL